MSENEINLRELDAWIAEHVMGWKMVESSSKNSPLVAAFKDTHKYFKHWKTESGYITLPKFTTDPAASFEVFKRCAEKLDTFTKCFHITISFHGGQWFCSCHPYLFEDEGQETLELAISNFARKLFTK